MLFTEICQLHDLILVSSIITFKEYNAYTVNDDMMLGLIKFKIQLQPQLSKLVWSPAQNRKNQNLVSFHVSYEWQCPSGPRAL